MFLVGLEPDRKKNSNKVKLFFRENNTSIVREITVEYPDTDKISKNQWLEWQFPVFSKRNGTRATKGELLKEKAITIDTETDKQGGEDYCHLNTVSIVSDDVKEVYFNKDQKQLVKKIRDRIYKINPLYIGGHNWLFDALVLREYAKEKNKDRIFTIGVDGTEPRMSGGRGGLVKKIKVNGRLAIDTLGFAQHWLWSPSNKLEAIADFFGITYLKSLDYGSLEELVISGDEKAIEKVKKYCLEDNITHYKLVKKILSYVLNISFAFQTDTDSVCYVSKQRLARKLYDKLHYETFNKFRTVSLKRNKFDIKEYKLKILKEAKFIKSERGFFEYPIQIFYSGFLVKALFEAIKQNESIRELYGEAITTDDKIEKIIYFQALDAFLSECVFDSTHYELLDWEFKKLYGLNRKEVKPKINQSLHLIESLFKKYNLRSINYSDKFIFLNGKLTDEALSNLEASGLAYLGQSDKTISGRNGRVIASIDEKIISSGIALNRSGGRTYFEKETINEFIRYLFKSDKDTAMSYLSKRCRELANGDISKEELIFVTVPGYELDEYSYPALKHRRVQTLINLGAEKNKKIAYAYGLNNGISEEMTLKDFMRDDIEIDLGKYHDRFFGPVTSTGRSRSFSKGNIADIVYSVMPARSKEDRERLTQIFEGKSVMLF